MEINLNKMNDYGHWKIDESLKEKMNDLESYLGFVYCITNNIDNKRYFGKKLFWNKKKRKPLKGKTRNRLSLVESDWKTYTSSCNDIKDLIKEKGKEIFSFEILSIHKSKSMINYQEIKLQLEHDVLLHPDKFYNGIINIRLSKISKDE